MRANSLAVALVVAGSFVIVSPFAAGAYLDAKNQDNIAEYYGRNSSTSHLPSGMQPATSKPYVWVCGLIGVVMVVAGVRVGGAAVPPRSETREY